MSGKYTAYNLTVRGRTSTGLGASAIQNNVFTREESMLLIVPVIWQV